jgi:hypothetical protein
VKQMSHRSVSEGRPFARSHSRVTTRRAGMKWPASHSCPYCKEADPVRFYRVSGRAFLKASGGAYQAHGDDQILSRSRRPVPPVLRRSFSPVLDECPLD